MGSVSATTITARSRVTVHFTLLLADGTLVDSTAEAEPITVQLGRGELLDALERCLCGLVVGEKRDFYIPAADVDLPIGEDLIQTLPRTEFPNDIDLEPGIVVAFELPNGEEIAGVVLASSDEEVVVDFAHPLAGHDLAFSVEVVAVENGPGAAETP